MKIYRLPVTRMVLLEVFHLGTYPYWIHWSTIANTWKFYSLATKDRVIDMNLTEVTMDDLTDEEQARVWMYYLDS